MNWQMITVVGTILLSVSTALWVIFSTSKDSCRFLRHYKRAGYKPDWNEEHWSQTR
jgi:hypothetical protein